MKFKGHLLKINGQEYLLKEQLGEGGFSHICSTSKPEAICKVQVISQASIAHAYNNEKIALTNLHHKNIVKKIGCKEQKVGDSNCGFMLLQNCSRGNAFDILDKEPASVPEQTILKIMYSVASALEHIHQKGFCHRDIKLQNVLKHEDGEFKLCDFGSCTQGIIQTINNNNRAQIEQYIEKTTTPIYRSPEQLDLYSGFAVGPKVDVFALGVLGFIMSFKKQPFETRLSAINNQYFLPEEHAYSTELIQIIKDCFTPDPRYRPSAKIIKQRLQILIIKKKAHIEINYDREFNQTSDQLSHISEKVFKNTTIAQSSFLSKIRKIYNQITTQTEGWIISFIQDSEEAPNLKFNRSIISKTWEKRYKVEKFYNILWKFSEQHQSKSLVTLKLLTLLHNFLRKGPKEAITYNGQDCPIKLCEKIYLRWKMNEKPNKQQDIKRNSFVVLLIRTYCLIIIGKIRLCYQNSDLLEGNYSILPFFISKDQNTILKLSIIEDMVDFLENCTKFHEQLQRNSYLIDIQRTILLSMVDEQYCLVSTLVFVFSAFKHAVQYVQDDLDLGKLRKKIASVQMKFKDVYLHMIKLFEKNSKLASLFQHNQFQLNPKVVGYITDIQISNQKKHFDTFKIGKYLNYKDTIHGLKIPLTYQEVVKNPQFLKDVESKKLTSKEYIQINQFKAQSPKIQNKKMSQQLSSLNSAETPMFKKTSVQQQTKKINPSNFSSFTLQIEPKPSKLSPQINKQIFDTMEFTHQNLNKDFMSLNQGKTTKQQNKFADFMSIVEQKYEDDKKMPKNNKPKQTDVPKSNKRDLLDTQISNNLQNTNKQSKSPSQNIKKIQLINFFDESDDEIVTLQPKNSNPPTKKQEQLNNNFEHLTANKQSRNDLVYLNSPKKQPTQKSSEKQNNVISKQQNIKKEKLQVRIQKQKKQMVSRIKQVHIVEDQFSLTKTTQSFIDLKQFIVEQVKKSAEQYFIQYSTLRFKKKIGFGHSSEVFKGQWRGREVAIKKIKDDISSPNAQKQFKRQIMTSVKIRHHPQLVTLIGVAQHDNFYYIINQFCQGATLFDVLHESKVPLPWKTRISMAKQIASGMLFLQTNEPPIIHRDLKSLNILLVNKYSDKHPDSMQIKIADFGLSRDFASTYMTGVLGTYHWMAPEIFNNEPYTLKADVYSFGIVLWEIMARKPPYLNMKNPQALMKFVTLENGRPDLNELPPDCPSQLKKLMIKSWDKEPTNRPDFQAILENLQKIQFF